MTIDTDMDLQQFELCLDLYGAELSSWPDEERAAGRQLLETSELARAAYAEADRVARMLDEVVAVEPSAALLQRLREVPRRHPRVTGARKVFSWWPFEGTVHPGLALAAAAALGILTGALASEAGVWSGSVSGGAPSGLSASDPSATDVSTADVPSRNAELVGEGAASRSLEDVTFTEDEVDEMSEMAFALHLDAGALDESQWEAWP